MSLILVYHVTYIGFSRLYFFIISIRKVMIFLNYIKYYVFQFFKNIFNRIEYLIFLMIKFSFIIVKYIVIYNVNVIDKLI